MATYVQSWKFKEIMSATSATSAGAGELVTCGTNEFCLLYRVHLHYSATAYFFKRKIEDGDGALAAAETLWSGQNIPAMGHIPFGAGTMPAALTNGASNMYVLAPGEIWGVHGTDASYYHLVQYWVYS